MDVSEYWEQYIAESLELLVRLEVALVDLEQNPTNSEPVQEVFRVIHTLKGSSGMYGFSGIETLTHDLETLYDAVKENNLRINAEIIQLTFEVTDYIRKTFSQEPADELETVYKQLVEKVSQTLTSAGLSLTDVVDEQNQFSENCLRIWKITFSPDSSILSRNINLLGSLNDMFAIGDSNVSVTPQENGNFVWTVHLTTQKSLAEIETAIFFIADYCKLEFLSEVHYPNPAPPATLPQAIPETTQPSPESKISTDNPKQLVNQRILVDSSKIDMLIYLVSELVTAKSELILSLENKEIVRIAEATEKIDKLSKQFRDNALNIRLVSLREILSRFRRMTRDLAKQLGKNVVFEVDGEDIELDKNIVEALSEPLMHLFRNCIDHGIESPEERITAGKHPVGILKFFAYKSGSFVFIQISDDGRGINKENILSRAIRKGIITESQLLDDKAVYDLLFLPGFSTSNSVSLISGRGIGMDIVKRKIQELRGEIFIDSEPGLGSSFTLKLQQTISIIDTLLVRASSAKYAIPIEDIECCELTASSSFLNKRNKHLSFQGQLIPFVYLNEVFQNTIETIDKQKVIVVNKQDKRFAIITDEIIGEYQAVVKPIGAAFQKTDFVSGASILGNGGIALILDTGKLIKLISQN